MTTAVAEKKPAKRQPSYGLQEVQRGLTALACANGNYRKAVRDLEEDDFKISRETLRRWAIDLHKDEYERIRREILPIVGAVVADEHMALARKQLALADKLADRLDKESDKLPIRDVATAMRNADVGSGIHTGNARELQGDYETPNQQRSTIELIRALQGKIGKDAVSIEGTAEEIE